jgi:nucleolar complex protein 3
VTQHTETLKLLFVLYFRILKETESTPLLSAALRGISRYAHHVNVDFFKDLITVLKGHINRAAAQTEDGPSSLVGDVRLRLDCTVTAFELLTGQGMFDAVAPTRTGLALFH